jgi:outer membrane lipoprotein carrier protein
VKSRRPPAAGVNRRTFCQALSIGVFGWTPAISPFACAAALDPLEYFFSNVKTLRAVFHQSVLTENLELIDESEGELWLSRPGRFRWNYGTPLEQVVVADGERLWVYDPGLEQAVLRDQDEALGHTPAGLLAGSISPTRSYLVERLGDQGGIDWVSVFPKDTDATFSQIQFGFESDTLRLVQMLDPLQQITRIRFSNVQINIAIPAERFTLEIPEGTDIIRETGSG